MVRYYARLATLSLLALALATAAGAILLLPSYFFIHAEADQASQYVASAGGIANERAKGQSQETLAAFNEAVRLLNTSARDPAFARIMGILTTDMPRGVSISTVDVVYDDQGSAAVKIAGVA